MSQTTLFIKPHGKEAVYTEWGDRISWPSVYVDDRFTYDKNAPSKIDTLVDALLNGTFDLDVKRFSEESKTMEVVRYVLHVPESVKRGWMQHAPELLGEPT